MIKSHRKGIALHDSINAKGIIMAKTLTPKEIAAQWEVTPKTLRKFLRKDEKVIATQTDATTPGKGGRWAIPASSLKSLKVRFDAWVAANAKVEEETDEATDEVEPTETGMDALMNALREMPEDDLIEGDNG